MRKALSVFTSVTFGVALGAGFGIYYSSIHRETPQAKPDTLPMDEPAQPVITRAPRDVQRIAELEQKLAAAKRPEQSGDAHRVGPPDLVEEKRIMDDRFRARLTGHDQEPIDPSWAPHAEGEYRNDLAEVNEQLRGSQKFDVHDVRCRTNTCVARVEWPSYDEAYDNYARVLHHRYKQNCAREIVLVDEARAGQPYSANVLFDCKERHAQASNP